MKLARHVRLEGPTAYLLDGAPWLGGRETGEIVPWRAADSPLPGHAVEDSSASAATTPLTRASWATRFPPEPLLFLKPPSALAGPGDAVKLPPESSRVEHEAELAVVMGRRAKNVLRDDALGQAFGFTCACDVTARDLQKKDVQFTRAKGFDTFCPLGPWVESELDPGALAVRCRVNGQTRQDGRTSSMIFDVPTLIPYVSRMMTLEPGDVILTGTPEGVGPLAAGDLLEVEVSGVGVLGLRVEG